MANTKSKRRQPGSIRPNGAGFQVRGYAGRDPLTKEDLYLHEQAETEVKAEKVRTLLLHQVVREADVSGGTHLPLYRGRVRGHRVPGGRGRPGSPGARGFRAG